MLRKLMKYEFRATARLMLPLYLAVLVLALGTRLSSEWMDRIHQADYTGLFGAWDPLEVLFVLVTTGAIVSLIAVFVVALVMMIVRFRNNLLHDEGYVMFTLPASAHQLVWSKLLVSAFWFVGAAVVDVLALFIMAAEQDLIANIFYELQEIFSEMTARYAVHGVLGIVEGLLLVLAVGVTACLRFYTPMSIGHSFARHKGLLSVAFYFVITVITQIGATMLITLGLPLLEDVDVLLTGLSSEATVHVALWATIIVEALYGAILYCLTIRMLRRHLNLE